MGGFDRTQNELLSAFVGHVDKTAKNELKKTVRKSYRTASCVFC